MRKQLLPLMVTLLIALTCGATLAYFISHSQDVRLEKAYERVDVACGSAKGQVFRQVVDAGASHRVEDESYRWARNCVTRP
jgi:hypothetical protein